MGCGELVGGFKYLSYIKNGIKYTYYTAADPSVTAAELTLPLCHALWVPQTGASGKNGMDT
jgi:hypothetical protein